MKIVVVYLLPVAALVPQAMDYCWRFASTYLENPPGHPVHLVPVSNGGRPSSNAEGLLSMLPGFLTFLEHDDSGYDIGAYQFAAQQIPCDLMVFLGTSAYLRHPNWARRVARSFADHGHGIYGAMGHTGAMGCNVHPHLRTTGFWLPPALMNQYPHRVTKPEQRYPFEHGPENITQWVVNQNLGAWVVAKGRDYPLMECNDIPNGFHNGDQSNLLIGDRLTEPPFFHIP